MKNTAQHTAGPWVSKGDTVETEAGLVICDVRHAGTHATGYNASLIAAAPDAHELLSILRQWYRESPGGRPSQYAFFDDARTWRQALADYFAKAEGTT